jgi:rSAM/selenodomain-associated transferase 2
MGKLSGEQEQRRIMLSIVIPTLDAVPGLATTLDGLAADLAAIDCEVIVADGGSTDGSAALAAAKGARLVTAPRGRGPQLAAGARAAMGDWLLFIHADTRLGPGWVAEAESFMVAANGECAGVFRLVFDDSARAARRLEAVARWRARVLGLPYGDQGLLISRAFYDSLGGFRELSLMEDVDLARRIGRCRFHHFQAPAITSAARYRRAGYLRRSARNLSCLALYFLGVDARLLVRLYG